MEHGQEEHAPLPDLTHKNPYAIVRTLYSHICWLNGEDAKDLENGTAIRQKEPTSLNDAVEQTFSPSNFHPPPTVLYVSEESVLLY